MKTKKSYEKPLTAVTQVELESPICSGSVDIKAQSPATTNTQAQEVNSGFATDNAFTANDNWDNQTH